MSRREYWGGGGIRFFSPVLDSDSERCVSRPAASLGLPSQVFQPV